MSTFNQSVHQHSSERQSRAKPAAGKRQGRDNRYDLIFHGVVLDNFNPEQVKKRFAKLFSLPEEKVEQLFVGKKVALKFNLDTDATKKFLRALEKIGARASAVAHIEKQKVEEPKEETKKEPVDAKVRKPIEKKKSAQTARQVEIQTEKQIENQTEKSAKKGEGKQVKAPVEVSAQPQTEQAPEATLQAENFGEENTQHNPAHYHSQVWQFSFTANGLEFFKQWGVNLLFSILSFGIYSAWASVSNRQYFYENTRLGNHCFEYVANPIDVLKARIVVVAIVIVGILLGSVNIVLGIVWGVGFLPWVMVRSLAFQAHHSAYRNVRFAFDGSTFEAAKVFIGWSCLALITLGVLAPAALYQQQRFIVENHRYGSARFSFVAAPVHYIPMVSALIGMALLSGMVVFSSNSSLYMVILPVSVLGVILLWAFFKVTKNNLRFSASTLHTVSTKRYGFQANWKLPTFSLLQLTNLLGIVLSMGLFIPWAKIRMAVYKAEHLGVKVFHQYED